LVFSRLRLAKTVNIIVLINIQKNMLRILALTLPLWRWLRPMFRPCRRKPQIFDPQTRLFNDLRLREIRRLSISLINPDPTV
jgi:hypothetical protein